MKHAVRREEARRILAPMRVDLRLLELASEMQPHARGRPVDRHLSVGPSTAVTKGSAPGVPSIASEMLAALRRSP